MPYTRRKQHKRTRHKRTLHKSTQQRNRRTKGGASARILTPLVPLLSALFNANTKDDQDDTIYELMTNIILLETSDDPDLSAEDEANINDIKKASFVLRNYSEQQFNAEKYKILTPVLLRLLKQCGTHHTRRVHTQPSSSALASPYSASPRIQKHPYTIKEAGGAGDCLYYSIFEALKEANLLHKLQAQMQFQSKTQFVAAMRVLQGIEARNHTASIDGAVSSMYDYLDWYEPDDSSVSEYFFKEMDIQPWLSETFIALVDHFEIYDYESYLKNKEAREAMYKAVIEDISTPGTYAQSYEVGLMDAILKRSGITMIVTYPTSLQKTIQVPPPANTIYIVNMTSEDARQDQNHFKYLSFISR